MSDLPFVTYQKFIERGDALDLAGVLENNEIEYIFEDNSLAYDSNFATHPLSQEFVIKLKKEDFPKVDQLQYETTKVLLETISSDYYLFSFTDEELKEVISQKDEWSKFDYLLAQKILEERGEEVSPAALETMETERIIEISKPETGQGAWIVAGYIFAFLGGLLGLFIGLHLIQKKTLPDGRRVHRFSESDRRHGKIILVIAAISFVFWAIVRLSGDA